MSESIVFHSLHFREEQDTCLVVETVPSINFSSKGLSYSLSLLCSVESYFNFRQAS